MELEAVFGSFFMSHLAQVEEGVGCQAASQAAGGSAVAGEEDPRSLGLIGGRWAPSGLELIL